MQFVGTQDLYIEDLYQMCELCNDTGWLPFTHGEITFDGMQAWEQRGARWINEVHIDGDSTDTISVKVQSRRPNKCPSVLPVNSG